MLTVNEVATRLRVSKYTVYRLIHSRSLPAVKMRNHSGRSAFRVSEEAVAGYLREGPPQIPLTAGGEPALLTAAEVANRLRCSVESVRRLVREGDLVATRNAGRNSHLRVSESALRDFLVGASTVRVEAS